MVHKNLIWWTYRCYTSFVHILTSQATIGRSSPGIMFMEETFENYNLQLI